MCHELLAALDPGQQFRKDSTTITVANGARHANRVELDNSRQPVSILNASNQMTTRLWQAAQIKPVAATAITSYPPRNLFSLLHFALHARPHRHRPAELYASCGTNPRLGAFLSLRREDCMDIHGDITDELSGDGMLIIDGAMSHWFPIP